ncbi:hypothetical protein V4U86_24745 [Mycobacterium sp. AMU20-3851]|uniref:hypothetical protein n=1 Tax=Mycobacterium sp. AMU20-3851 TaxID=3122055 RepID=UPI0037553AE9
MGVLDLPKADLDDAEVAAALSRAAALADLILDALVEFDPLGLRERTHDLDGGDCGLGKALNVTASVLDWADVPGTQAWEGKDRNSRINWWVHRVGALNNIAVAFPGAFGVIARQLPLQDALGFANQTLILCAVAREYDLTDRQAQVRMLAAVLCGRDIPDPPLAPAEHEWPDSLPKKLWHLAGILNAISDEVGKRPHPNTVFRYLGMLPAVGAVATYLGEFGALHRAAKAGEKWIKQA